MVRAFLRYDAYSFSSLQQKPARGRGPGKDAGHPRNFFQQQHPE
jgi:hypothetical protein